MNLYIKGRDISNHPSHQSIVESEIEPEEA